MNANRMHNIIVKDKARVSEKLSSGYKVNRAADDAAGLAISEKMRRQIRGLNQASLNAQDGISCVQSAEGALNEVHEMLQRMNELCVKAANDTNDVTDREYIQSEIDALVEEIDRVGATTTFNEIKLLNGERQDHITALTPTLDYAGIQNQSLVQATEDSLAYFSVKPLNEGDILTKTEGSETVFYKVNGSDADADGTAEHPYSIEKKEVYKHICDRILDANVIQTGHVSVSYAIGGPDEGKFNIEFKAPLSIKLQIGSEVEDENQMTIIINPINSSSLGVHNVNVTGATNNGALTGMDLVKRAIEKNSRERSNLGAYQNRLEHTIKNLDNVAENTQAAESELRDTDMAQMISEMAKKDILMQAGQMILSQANKSKEAVIQLLQ